jgi:hypothetical protein
MRAVNVAFFRLASLSLLGLIARGCAAFFSAKIFIDS